LQWHDFYAVYSIGFKGWFYRIKSENIPKVPEPGNTGVGNNKAVKGFWFSQSPFYLRKEARK